MKKSDAPGKALQPVGHLRANAKRTLHKSERRLAKREIRNEILPRPAASPALPD